MLYSDGVSNTVHLMGYIRNLIPREEELGRSDHFRPHISVIHNYNCDKLAVLHILRFFDMLVIGASSEISGRCLQDLIPT